MNIDQAGVDASIYRLDLLRVLEWSLLGRKSGGPVVIVAPYLTELKIGGVKTHIFKVRR